IEHAGISVTGNGIKVVVQFFDVLAVIALPIRQAKQPLLEDRITAIPQGNREAQQLTVIGKAGNAVFAPTVGAAAGMVMGEIVPCGSARTIVLAHRPPLSLA